MFYKENVWGTAALYRLSQTIDKTRLKLNFNRVLLVFFIKYSPKTDSCLRGVGFFRLRQLRVANFFKFIAAKISIACTVFFPFL